MPTVNMSFIKTSILTISVLTLLLIPINNCEGKGKDIAYAGFAFCGNHKDIPVNFKYTYDLVNSTKNEKGRSIFDREFTRFFNKNKSSIKNFNLIIGGGTDTKISMAVALARENITIEKIADLHKVVVNLCSNVIFLDFESMEVISSFPFYLEYIDVGKKYPKDEYISELLRKLYFSEDFSILKLIKERLSSFTLKDNSNLSLKIINVEIEDLAKEKLDRYQDNSAALKSLIAQRFSDFLSDRLKVAVLPYAKDYLGARMALAFSDARIQNFEIPPSSYGMDFIIRKLVKQEYKKTSAEDSFLYGVYTTLKIYDPDLGTGYWNKKIKYGAIKAFPKLQKDRDDFAVFDEIIGIVMVKAIKEMKKDKKLYKEVIRRCSSE